MCLLQFTVLRLFCSLVLVKVLTLLLWICHSWVCLVHLGTSFFQEVLILSATWHFSFLLSCCILEGRRFFHSFGRTFVKVWLTMSVEFHPKAFEVSHTHWILKAPTQSFCPNDECGFCFGRDLHKRWHFTYIPNDIFHTSMVKICVCSTPMDSHYFSILTNWAEFVVVGS